MKKSPDFITTTLPFLVFLFLTFFTMSNLAAASLSGTCKSWMEITMQNNPEDACSKFVNDGYIRDPDKNGCVICDPDDWTPSSQPGGGWLGTGDASSNHGKYSGLIQKMNCPKDTATYGSFRDWGYWAGGPWCNQQGQAGYWVWDAPNWYVWKDKP